MRSLRLVCISSSSLFHFRRAFRSFFLSTTSLTSEIIQFSLRKNKALNKKSHVFLNLFLSIPLNPVQVHFLIYSWTTGWGFWGVDSCSSSSSVLCRACCGPRSVSGTAGHPQMPTEGLPGSGDLARGFLALSLPWTPPSQLWRSPWNFVRSRFYNEHKGKSIGFKGNQFYGNIVSEITDMNFFTKTAAGASGRQRFIRV